MGAEILEVHVTYDKDIKTFDSSSSLDFKELEFLKKSLNRIKIIKSNKINKNKIPKYLISNKKLFEKSIFLKKDLKKGSLIKLDDISFKKPVVGMHAKEYKSVIGKKLKINLKKGNPLLKKYKMKKICFVIASRANYGRVKSVVIEFKKSKKYKVQIVLAASSLLERYGDLRKTLSSDGLKVDREAFLVVEGESPFNNDKINRISYY